MVRRIAAGFSLIVALNLALAPSVAVAGGRVAGGRPMASHSFGHHSFVGRPFVGRPFVGRPFVGRPFVHHHVFPHHFVRPFVPFVSVVVPPLGYYAPYYSTPTYLDPSYNTPPPSYAPPAYYNPPVSYAPPSYAPPPESSISVVPVPNVVEYPNGRYVLRGDGTTTPYTWVWIPNPPPPPPASPPAGSPPPASNPPSRRPTSLYRWIDERGDIHLTDSLEMVPKKFRPQTKETQL
jgi:hypothetical protein